MIDIIQAASAEQLDHEGGGLRGLARPRRRHLRKEADVRPHPSPWHGIGRALADRVVAAAKVAGYDQMRLDTSVGQAEAIGLYKSAGFRPIAPHYSLPDDIKGWLLFRSLSLEDPNGPHPDGYGRTLCISRSSIRAPIVRERYAAAPGACRSAGSWIAPSLTATGSARLQVRTSDAGCSQIGLGSSRPFRRRHLPNARASPVEVVDVSLRIGYRGIGTGPGEADLKRGKQHAIDNDRLQIRPPDPGVPQTFSGLEGFDLKAVIVHLRDSGHFPKPPAT